MSIKVKLYFFPLAFFPESYGLLLFGRSSDSFRILLPSRF